MLRLRNWNSQSTREFSSATLSLLGVLFCQKKNSCITMFQYGMVFEHKICNLVVHLFKELNIEVIKVSVYIIKI